MAATPRKSISEASSPLAPFSYAQAAKGISSAGSSTAQSSKAPSGSTTTPKESDSVTTSISELPSGASWAAEAEGAPEEQESHQILAPNVPESPDTSVPSNNLSEDQQPNGYSGISSPELGTSSMSTLVKEDDATSVANNSSESTWENKSQVSNTAEKTAESGSSGIETAETESIEKPKESPRTLQEAPIPVVNIWKQRAEQAKAKAALSAGSVKSPSSAVPEKTSKTLDDRAVESLKDETRRKSKPGPVLEGSGISPSMSRPRRISMGGSSKQMEEERTHHGRRESRSDLGADRLRRNMPSLPERARASENAPLPPTRDQESWPTPDNAQDEGRRKTLGKSEKPEKDKNPAAAPRSHGKNEWVTVQFTPTVVFSTPLPSISARRGGRGGSRGGRDIGSRTHPGAPSGSSTEEKEGSPIGSLANGDSIKRERPGGSSARETSPVKGRRPTSADPGELCAFGSSSEAVIKAMPATAPDTQLARPHSPSEEFAAGQHSRSQSLVASKQPSFSRQQRQNRKYENNATHIDRRREADPSPLANENDLSPSRDRRASIAPQTDGK